MTKIKETDWMGTFSGTRFWPLEPEAEHVHLADLAHAMATTNRFGGHAIIPISVAQHCLMVADLVRPDLKLAALLHDAEEAYLGDHLRPVKRRTFYAVQMRGRGEPPVYLSASEMGHRVRHCIFNRFVVPWPTEADWDHIDFYDCVALSTEG